MRTVTCVLDLAKVFQLVKDGFNQGSPLEKRLVEWRVLDQLHVLAHPGDEVHLTGAHQVNQPSGDVSFVGIHPAKEPATQEGNRFAIINVAWRDFDAQQFAMVVDGYMEFVG
jgi:hypothetical protein